MPNKDGAMQRELRRIQTNLHVLVNYILRWSTFFVLPMGDLTA